jgi:hypothetical protein
MRILIVSVMLLVALGSKRASAEVESDAVKSGVAAYDALEFARAVEILNQALSESLTREEKLVALRTLAFAYCALERTDDARTAFVRLLRIDPSTELPTSVAPRVRALFEEARARVATGPASEGESTPLPALRIEVRPEHPSEGATLSITAVAAGGLGRSAALFYRARGEQRYSEVRSEGRDGRFQLTLPGSDVRAPAMEYYVTALDERRTPIARSGGLTEPLHLAVAVRKRPAYKRGWVWGVVGGVLAVGAAAAAVLAIELAPPDPKAPADVMLIAPR